MESLTSGVQTILGDPKRAVLRLLLPIMAAMFVQSLDFIFEGWSERCGAFSKSLRKARPGKISA